MDKKIIMSVFGGLGDNLQHTPLPYLFSKLGYDVYVSNRIPYRNPQIKEFVWEHNPYILGFSDEEPNCGDLEHIVYRNHGYGYMKNWQFVHGITPEIDYPLIYYSPQKIRDIDENDVILLDVTATSLKEDYDPEQIRKYVTEHYDKNNIKLCVFEDGVSYPLLFLDQYDAIFVKDLYHYSDLIFSCMKYVCLFSGGMVLASAIKQHGKLDVDCLVVDNAKLRIGEMNQHYFFDNIKYIWL